MPDDSGDSENDGGQAPVLPNCNYPPAPLKLQPKPEILVLGNLVKENSG